MSNGVFTLDHRITYLKGQVTTGTPDTGFVACGTGTLFPAQVTIDQLAEICYRVRDASWSGSLSSPTVGQTSFYGTRPVDFNDGSNTRGYRDWTILGTLDSNGTIESEMDIWKWGEIPWNLGNFVPLQYGRTGLSCYINNGFINGSYYEPDVPDVYGVFTFYDPEDPESSWSYDPGYLQLDFGEYTALQFGDANLKVAWIDSDGSGNPFSGGNPLYLYVDFYVYISNGGPLATDKLFRSYFPDLYDGYLTSATFKIVLSASEIIFPLYHPSDDSAFWPTGELVLTADSWFPYAKDSPAVPVWNSATGALL